MEASGLVAAHAANPRGIAVKLLRSDHRRRHRHGLHHCREQEMKTEESLELVSHCWPAPRFEMTRKH